MLPWLRSTNWAGSNANDALRGAGSAGLYQLATLRVASAVSTPRTDLNNFAGTRTVEQGAREAVRLALIGAHGPTGTFSDEDGPVPW